MARSSVSLARILVLVAAAPCGGSACQDRNVSHAADARLDHRARQLDLELADGLWMEAGEPTDAAVSDVFSPAVDASPCTCPTSQVFRISSCLTTDQLGCGAGCSSTSSCSNGWTCEPCAATESCTSSTCKPACVPVAGTSSLPSSGLRISPTYGQITYTKTITVEGAPFTVGAKAYDVRLGYTAVTATTGSACTLSATFSLSSPAIHAVEVSQYGGGAPWVLAGMFSVTSGGAPATMAQPGYPCSKSLPCAEATPYVCTCTSGRCACK
jgi:hypothetical protein